MAAELEACVLLTCQSLPSVELCPGGVPLLHPQAFWNPDTTTRGEAQLVLLNNGDNPGGTLRFGLEPGFSRFLESDTPNTPTDPHTAPHQGEQPPG